MYGHRKYTMFIDESGEAGVKKIRGEGKSGASPFLTLGAILFVTKDLDLHRELLSEIKTVTNKSDVQCKNLSHFQKVYFAKKVSQIEHALCFGVISKKETLGKYKERIENDSSKFYNKCCLYLFEMVGKFLRDAGIAMNEIDFVMEKGNFDYDGLRSYLRKCRDNPIYEQSKMLAYLDPNNIIKIAWKDEELLTYADFVAHSLYKVVDKPLSTYELNETRYLYELRNKFLKSKKEQKLVGSGIKVIHKVSDLGLDKETSSFLENLSG